MQKYALIILSLALIATGVYALKSETLSERVERENRETLIRCLDEASKKSTTQEILQAKNACQESILTKIIIPTDTDTSSGKVSNTWTVAPAISGVPKQWIKNAESSVANVTSVADSKKNISKVSIQKNVKNSSQSGTFWQAYDLAIPLIRKHEWLRLKAYPDPEKCSIWYGTRAKSCSEVITQAEADKRLWSIVKQLTTRVQQDFPTLSPKQHAWLISFAFNCHAGYRDVQKHWLIRHSLWCKTAWWKVLPWLVERRKEEASMIFSWN